MRLRALLAAALLIASAAPVLAYPSPPFNFATPHATLWSNRQSDPYMSPAGGVGTRPLLVIYVTCSPPPSQRRRGLNLIRRVKPGSETTP